MADFNFACPQCGRFIPCDTRLAGEPIKCPLCHHAITAPAASGAAAAAPPPKRTESRPLTKVLILAAVVLVFAGLLAGGGFVLAHSKVRPGGPHLIGWWKLDDGSGNAVKDSGPLFHGNNGRLVGVPKWVKGRNGGALQLDGSQYVALGNIFPDGYQEMTIACWVKHPRSQWQNIVERSIWDQADGLGLMMDYNSKSVTFGHYGELGAVRSQADVQDNQWHHVAGTLRRRGSEHQIEQVGAKLRAMMPWIGKNKIVDKTKN